MSAVQHVTSVDGTRIGYVTSGTGPPLVMVHGATADHTALSRVIPSSSPTSRFTPSTAAVGG